MCTKMSIVRFRKIFDVNVIGVYRKGKNSKLDIDTVRLLVQKPNWSWVNGDFILMMPELPRTDFPPQMKSGRCGVAGLPMSERPELMGDMEPIDAFDIDANALPSTIRNRGRNYYLLEHVTMDDLYDILYGKLPCIQFS